MSHTGRVALGAGVALLLALGACGGGAGSLDQPGGSGEESGRSSTYSMLNNLPAGRQEDRAAKLAKKRGATLTLYTSYQSDVAAAVKKAFQDKYGISVDLYRSHSSTLLQRLLQEASAGRIGADVVEASGPQLMALADKSLLSAYRGKNRKNVRKAGLFELWTADSFNIFLPAWNTNLVRAGKEPRSWRDLAAPRFDGRLVFEQSDFEWYAALTLLLRRKGMSEERIQRYWGRVVNNARVTKGHSTMMTLLSAGQVPVVGENYTYITRRAVNEGVPVAYRSRDGVAHTPGFPRPNGVGLLKGAQHPTAAWLFAHWLLSPEGQKLLADNYITPSTKAKGEESLQGIRLAEYPARRIHAHSEVWSKRFDELVRGVPAQK